MVDTIKAFHYCLLLTCNTQRAEKRRFSALWHGKMRVMYKIQRSKKGFTLIEMLVVLGIIGLLAAITITSISSARATSRDKVRISDIEQLRLSFRLLLESAGSYPTNVTYEGGVSINSVTELKTFGRVPVDPIDNSTYKYVYDSQYSCKGTKQVVYATALEKLPDANEDVLCGTNGSTKYIAVLR